ncbi:MAG: hypothetical protein K2H12_11335, partial [Acetatifactor sp.]|nr:hypothetical protein [Acetatifactor sp.]
SDLKQNARVELASHNITTGKWIRIGGIAEEDDTPVTHELVLSCYPTLKQKYPEEQEVFLAAFRICVEDMGVH